MPKAKKLPSGNYRVRVYDNTTGKYKSFTAPTKKQAELLGIEWLNSEHRSEEDRTVGELLTAYIESKRNVLAQCTILSYENAKRNALAELCNIPAAQLTSEKLQIYFNNLAVTYSPESVKLIYSKLMCVLHRYLPDRRYNVTLPKKQRKIKNFPEVHELLLALKDTDIELPCLFALWLGLRISEVRGVKKSDIQGGVLTISETIVYSHGVNIRQSTTKTFNSRRQIRVPQYMLDLIENVETEYITTFSYHQLNNKFKKILRENNLPSMTFHDLRHMNASIMLALNVPDKYAMERGGWSSPAVLKTVYQHTFTSERTLIDNEIDNFMYKSLSAKEKDSQE